MKKARSFFSYLLLAVVLVTAFFAHETITINETKVKNARADWIVAKAKRTETLNAFKAAYQHTAEYKTYFKEKQNTDLLYSKVKSVESDVSFLGFPSFQYFVGEFGWAFGLFIIGFYMLIRDISKNSKTLIGEVFVDGTIISVALFFMTWAFYYKQDFNKLNYLVVNVLLSITICYGAFLIQKHKKEAISRLKSSVKELINLVVRIRKKEVDPNNPPEFDKEMYKSLKKVSDV